MASPTPLRRSSREDMETVWFKSWDAKIPPPFNSFKGKVVPRLFLRGIHRRKIAIEVLKVPAPAGPRESVPPYYEQCILRILVPVAAAGDAAAANGGSIDSGSNGPAEDEESTLMSPEFLDATEGSVDPADRCDRHRWRAKYRFPIKAISITNTHKNSVTVHIVLGTVRQHREIIFGTVNDARDFAQVIQAHLDREPERVARKLQVTARDVPLQKGESITLLVEICSARSLLIGDQKTSDPYVQVLLDGKEIHRTDYVTKSLDPIWTIKTNSLFLWTIDVKDLFVGDGLLCAVYDFNQVGHHTDLGHAHIPPSVLYDATEERVELPLNPPAWWDGDAEACGWLAVRCRRASAYDINFMNELAETRKKEKREEAAPELQKMKNITKLATESAGGSGNVASMLTRRSKVIKTDEHPRGVKMYKVRPGPDPKRPKETKWMSQEELHKESFKDSQEWIDSGSGHLGFLFVEILACDELPNLDTGGIIGNKTDAFVAVVFEDSFVTTDVIDDCLAPRWMPWSKRAFMFRIMHSSSQLFLGVFDYDVSFNPVDGHDLVGRASVDLSNLRKNTVYTLKYNLYTTSRMSQRKKRGTVTLRIRLDVEDDRQFLLASLEPPPRIRVNTKNWKDYHVVQSTCIGKIDVEKYSMHTINSYIEELLALQQTAFYLKDAAASLMLWRGTAPVTLNGRTFMIPIHSMTAFTLLALLVEHPNLLPSCTMFGIAWFLLAVMQYRQHLPDVWSRCKSFRELMECLVFGVSQTPPDYIEPFTNSEAANAFMKEWLTRLLEAEKAASAACENAPVDMDKEEQMVWQTDGFPSKSGGVNLDPIRPILFPVQQNLAMVCKLIRQIKCIIFWEECYITFWIVSACLLLGTIFLFVPWFFIIQWSARVLVWTFFGPWMKFVDVFYLGRQDQTGALDSLARVEMERWKRQKTARIKARINVENEQKLRAMKEYMFGRFVTRVPVLKEDRYRDMPLPDSSATPYVANLLPLSELAMLEAGYKRKRLIGQHIIGNMIPRIETQGLTDAPVGRATAKPRLVDRREPGGKLTMGPSTLSAYTQIGFLVFAAGILTWLGVPTISHLTMLLLKRT